MKTFKQFLNEEWSKIVHPDDPDSHIISNKTNVSGKKVKTDFEHKGNGHYTVSFDKDGSYYPDAFIRKPRLRARNKLKSIRRKNNQTNVQVTRQVVKDIGRFIKKVRPTKLSYSAVRTDIENHYASLGKHLANKFGGSYKTKMVPDQKNPHHIVTFPGDSIITKIKRKFKGKK